MSLIGLISDSHGRAAITRKGVGLLVQQGAQALVHLGDINSTAVLDELVVGDPNQPNQTIAAHVVFGNTDLDWPELARHAQHLGLQVHHPMGYLPLTNDRGFFFTHGDQPDLLQQALERHPAYLCHGHTHRQTDIRQGDTRIINPGALCRAAIYSVALLNTDSDIVTFFPIQDP